MTAHEKLEIPEVRSKVSPEEWQLRVDLAAAYRLVAMFGWSDLVFTHISARVPGPEHHFLINPYGFLFDEITASSLIKVDLSGNKVMESPDSNGFPINPAGFVIHSAVHAAREDAHCVLHVHSANGVAVSARKEGLLPISQQSIFVMSSLGYHDYEGVALLEDEKPRLVRDLGSNTYLMLKNHGLLTVGSSVAEAWVAMYIFESACNIQVRAMGAGGANVDNLLMIPQNILDGGMRQLQEATRGQGAGLVWPGLLRKLDKVDPSYRT